MSRIHYMHCPVCGSGKLENTFQAKDYTVSGEAFWITECKNCSLRFTQDVPDDAAIGPYYRSENYISHSDTAKGFINKMYHFVRKRTLTKKRRLIQRRTGLKKGRVLDVGSGTGAFLDEMRKSEWDIKGLEPDPGARNIAKERYSIQLADAGFFYHLPSRSFDAITLWHVLEHVHDLPGYINKLRDILKEQGRIFIAVPNYTSMDASKYKEYWAAYDVPRHLYHFSPKSMQVLMEKHGLQIEKYKPMWYDSFYISLLSSKYKNGKSNLLAAGLTGFASNLVALFNWKRCSSVIYVVKRRK